MSILPDSESQKVETPPAVLQIAGISLDHEGFSSIPVKLGETVAVSRGDASTGRKQFCFASSKKSVHLIFEEGEVHYAYFLFAGGKDWNGSRYCHRSELVSQATGNAAGIHLGMSPAQVQDILGEPLIAAADKIIYSRVTKKATTPPDQYYDVVVQIEGRFTASKLVYFAVVKSEIN